MRVYLNITGPPALIDTDVEHPNVPLKDSCKSEKFIVLCSENFRLTKYKKFSTHKI